ncbi:hypothetical protein PbDSM24746_41460 [Paenibacillus macerans]|nr:hypothetical protein PbDSM24746_41460 [Paenibacillus macerans]GBK70692.1 hypothetical protein PbJCM17693_44000 [Paenibacillus macerans]GIP10900.1 hypothetical protein J1TS5_30700 [Paenibacillus macerans]
MGMGAYPFPPARPTYRFKTVPVISGQFRKERQAHIDGRKRHVRSGKFRSGTARSGKYPAA